jgi:hypothetical protein
MPRIIKVRCNGPGKHENEIDLDDLPGDDVVMYRTTISPPPNRQPRNRYVLPCCVCTEGKVIVTRKMIDENS